MFTLIAPGIRASPFVRLSFLISPNRCRSFPMSILLYQILFFPVPVFILPFFFCYLFLELLCGASGVRANRSEPMAYLLLFYSLVSTSFPYSYSDSPPSFDVEAFKTLAFFILSTCTTLVSFLSCSLTLWFL